MNSLSAGLRNPKTTVLGVLVFVQAAIAAAIAHFDGVAETVPDWNGVVTALIAAIALVLARDADVSSKSSGAK